MDAFVRVTRRGGVIFIAVISMVIALGLVYAVFNGGAISRLPTLQLFGLLALLALPIVTMGLLRLDQVTARERGVR